MSYLRRPVLFKCSPGANKQPLMTEKIAYDDVSVCAKSSLYDVYLCTYTTTMKNKCEINEHQ